MRWYGLVGKYLHIKGESFVSGTEAWVQTFEFSFY